MIEKFSDVRDFGIYQEIDAFKNNESKTLQTPDIDILKTLEFNESTKWADDTLPKSFIEYGKRPPFIAEVHKQDILGQGVNVAIIDQPLALNHPEYKNKIVEYKTFSPNGSDLGVSSMHGPAVVSLLAGNKLGTAPNVNVYYAAIPSWLGDAQYETEALKWILEVNKKLDDDKKIKFVSVSAAPGNKNMRPKNYDLWNKMVEDVEKQGICVVDCTKGHGFIAPGFIDYDTKEFKYGFPDKIIGTPQKECVHVPNSLRTVAESYDNKHFSYTYCGVAGVSWAIPYAVGVLCLGQQINNKLSAMELKNLLIKTAQRKNNIIDPESFIKEVEKITLVERDND